MTNKPRLLASPDVVGQTAPERAVAEIIVSALQLDLRPSDIRPETRLIGGGLGLKAIDILDVALCICRTYGFDAGMDDVPHQEIFASLRSLSAYVEAHGRLRRLVWVSASGVVAHKPVLGPRSPKPAGCTSGA